MNSKYTKILLALTICLLMSACSDDIFSGSDYFDNGKVTLRLVVPATTVVNTRANTDETISGNDLYVIEYGDQGSFVAMRKVEPSNFSDNTLTINDVNTKTTDIHIVANGDAILKGKDNIAKLDGVYCDEIPSPPVLWGHINMSDLKSGTNNTVSLLRNVALATLNKAESIKDKFEITGWEITQTATQGSIAPKDYKDYTVGNTNEPTGDKLDKTIGNCEGSNAREALYLFETPAKVDSRIVIKANEKYYTANFLDAEGSKLSLLRNHHYKITVTATGEGYNTKEEALKAPAGNIKVEIKDYNFMVTNLISNGAYELGTCDTVRVEAGEKTYSSGEAYFVTMWGNGVKAENITPKLSTPTDSWLTEVSKDGGTDISSADYSSAGKGYKLTFKCLENPSEEIRQTKLTVTFGVLKRDIVIVQQGSNLKKARVTKIYGLQGDGENGRDYIKFISKEVNGTSRTAMGGTSERDNGLQLGIGSENNYYYTIAKNDGDDYETDETVVKVTDNRTFYTIEAKNKNDEEVWTRQFTIKTEGGHKIIYDIYHTGIFQEEKDTYQPTSNRTNTKVWYYYELIKSENGVWMLDRNLGATSVDDPGGYYCIKKGDRDKPMADICPPGFSIPTSSLWKQLTPEMKLVTRTTGSGTTYQSIELPAATTAQSKSIRFPRGGMHNGYEVTNPSIGYYWSATIVSGNQGFDFSSNEYGYWYNVARLSSGSQGMQNVRYVDGKNSTVVYKYLNTRCVKSSSAVLDKNRLTIHDKRTSTQPLYIYIYTENNEYRNRRYGEKIRSTGGSETTIYYDMIDPERIKESFGENKPLYIRFRQGDDLVDSGWIGEKKLVGNQREFTVHDSSFE
ncbi:BACON domain-containing carbohydrate-binding protein [Segatella copri]|uniref:BACON domain-containing protein n=1 Tax=Segatella copri TaxID=165179 RepID=UPI002FF3AC2D